MQHVAVQKLAGVAEAVMRSRLLRLPLRRGTEYSGTMTSESLLS